jgi:hypothetical protein
MASNNDTERAATTAPDWKSVLREWTSAAMPLIEGAISDGFFLNDPWSDEYHDLNEKFMGASPQEIDAWKNNPFGPIGDVIPVLKPAAALWLMPIMLKRGATTDESILAMAAVNALRQRVSKMPSWTAIIRTLSPETRHCLSQLALSCCRHGWHDEKRVAKRKDECRRIFFA